MSCPEYTGLVFKNLPESLSNPFLTSSKDLKNWKKNYDEMISEYGQYALCPPPPKGHGCGIEASGFDEITKIFGYRGKRVQSLCRKCRSGHSSDRRK